MNMMISYQELVRTFLRYQEHINASKNDACNNSKSYKRPEISQVIGFMSDTAYSIYLKKWQSKYYHQIQIKKKTNNNHNQVVHNITSL